MKENRKAFYWLFGVSAFYSFKSFYQFFSEGAKGLVGGSFFYSFSYSFNSLLIAVTPFLLFALYRKGKYSFIVFFMAFYIVMQVILHTVEIYITTSQSGIFAAKFLGLALKTSVILFLTFKFRKNSKQIRIN